MPLTVNNGTALNPQPPAAAAQFVVNIPHRPQEGRLWCWAACVQMVLEHNNIQMSQCEIVRRKLEEPQHVCVDNHNLRTESCRPRLMKSTWRRCGIQGVNAIDWPIRMNDIKAEIAADRPIQVGILWDEHEGGGGHAVLIKGWTQTSPEALLIDDPLRESFMGESRFGTGQATHEDLVDALGHGIWRYTWANLH
jgi:hypothetical protein